MFVGRFTFLLTSFLLAACQPIAGTLTVAERLVLNVTEYEGPQDPWCRRGHDRDCKEPVAIVKTGRFHPGSYRAQLELDAKDAIRLTLFEARKLKSVVNLAVPRGACLPQHEGQFRLAADETGQPYDVAGEVATTYAVSPVETAWQSCAHSLERWVCKDDAAHDHDYEKCAHEYVTVYGERPVEYHHEYETKTVTLELIAQRSDESLARFEGASTGTSLVYDYRGPCHYGPLAGW